MNHSSASCTSFFRRFFLLLLFFALPFHASAQAKKPAVEPPPPPPKKTAAPAPKPAPRPAAPSSTDQDKNADHRDDNRRNDDNKNASAAHSGGSNNSSTMNHGNSAGSPNSRPNSNSANRTPNGANRMGGKTAGADRTPPAPVEKDPRAPTGLNLRASSSAGSGVSHPNPSTAPNAAHANNIPGAVKLPNGNSKLARPDGSSVEWNRNGKLSAVTTPTGASARMDAFGKPVAIRDGKGTTISRGPHGERTIETIRTDHSRLVSDGRHGGYLEHPIMRGGHPFAQRTYFYNGRIYSRVYAPYNYLGYPYFGYIPAYYYAPGFYGWAFNPWSQPVAFSWGWNGDPWFSADAYYFSPYASYVAPAFWLTDYAIGQDLQAAAEDTDSSSLGSDPSLVYVSAQAAPQAPANGSPLVSAAVKDQIAEQVKQIIGDEKDAASSASTSAGYTPAVPPSLDPRFALFIVSSALSLETDSIPCSLTAGDIVHRKDYAPDAQGTIAVDVTVSKSGDCPVGTVSRLKVEDLEEMHDNLRQKVDDGMKSLAENQGKKGIPNGPAANPQQVAAGQADPDPTVADALKKQQQDADQTEKDIQAVASSSNSSGSTD